MGIVVQGHFLSAADRAALQAFSGDFLYGHPDALEHVMMHIDRIHSAQNPEVQAAICQGVIWAYQRAMLLPLRDVKRLESEVYNATLAARHHP